VGGRRRSRLETGPALSRVIVAVVALAAAAPAPAAASSWTGTFRLPANAEQVTVALELSAGRATVALGPGHLGRTSLPASDRAGRVRFTLPGGVTFEGRRQGKALAGTVRQGSLRGSFRLRPGASRVLPALGLYRAQDGAAVAIVQAAGLPTWLVELPSGDIHGLNSKLTTVGARLGSTSGAGTLAVAPTRITWTRAGTAKQYARVRLHQSEVRVGVGAATLTIPEGPGPFPAVVMTHGSGPQARDEFQVFSAFCELLGIAVIADDKRGIGQSRGVYPGERAVPSTIDILARDAQAEARYLARLPKIDRSRIGVLGDSQAGWVIARAAAREPAFRWAVPLVGPTTTVDEADAWGELAGQGQAPKTGTDEEMLAQVRAAGRGGFDPVPYLRRLTIPVHWVFADDDRNVPTELCIERLRPLQAGHDFTWTTIHATHSLLELPSGLNSGLARSRGFGSTLFPSVAAWLREHKIAR
jgi:pimeloyl-ACP methyl ester carboxylesterase